MEKLSFLDGGGGGIWNGLVDVGGINDAVVFFGAVGWALCMDQWVAVNKLVPPTRRACGHRSKCVPKNGLVTPRITLRCALSTFEAVHCFPTPLAASDSFRLTIERNA